MIQEVKMFGAQCDHCKKQWLDEHNGFVAMSDGSSMSNILADEGWARGDTEENEGKDGEHYCLDCFSYDDDDNFILDPKRKDIHKDD